MRVLVRTLLPADLNQWLTTETANIESAAAATDITEHLALFPDLLPILGDSDWLSLTIQELLDNGRLLRRGRGVHGCAD